jgi:GTP-binding protein
MVRKPITDREEMEVRVTKGRKGVMGKLVLQKEMESVEEKLLDFDSVGEPVRVARGGKGGRGNEHFKSSRMTTPMIAERGQDGECFEAELELRLLADVGLVGMPNAGKSTLLSVISNARPKIADYEFTTLEPNLGVVRSGKKSLVVADIPGLIEGASVGRGLGVTFLKHVEKTNLLLHLIALDRGEAEELFEKYQTVRAELKNFSESLAKKKEMIVLTKADLVDEKKIEEVVKLFLKKKKKVFVISAGSSMGVRELVETVVRQF